MSRRTLQARLVAWYAVAMIVLIGLFATAVLSQVRDALVEQITEDLARETRLVSRLVGSEGLERTVDELATATDARITIIAADGTVLADSAFDPSLMEDHSTRPEVIGARRGEVGTDRRVSATTGEPQLYVAIDQADGTVVRLAVTEAQIAERLASVRNAVVGAGLIVGLIGVAVVVLVSRRLSRPLRTLTSAAGELAAGDLDVRPERSSVAELDDLAVAIGRVAEEWSRRVVESQEEHRTLQLVLGVLPQGVMLVEAGDEIGYVNPAARQMLGTVGGRLAELTPLAIGRLVRQARDEGSLAEATVEHGTPARALRLVATPFEGDDRRVLVVAFDVTERQRIEQMRRDFVADASHELKTPIASVLASVEALQMAMTRDPERAEGFAAQAESSARQLARIVEDLLDLSRLEASELPLEPVALEQVVADEVARIRPRADEARVALTVELAPVTVLGSERDLALAVRNLFDNALRYTDPGGSITVRLTRVGDRASFEVSDTGMGIPTRALGRVFERFFRVDAARSRATGGTGLGLSIVRHVAERHGGTVSVESELGVGSTFRVEMPVLVDANRRP